MCRWWSSSGRPRAHIGAPVNEWADLAAAEAARTAGEAMPELRAAGYASLEVQHPDNQLISGGPNGGPREVAAAAARREVVRRLEAASGSVQMVEVRGSRG